MHVELEHLTEADIDQLAARVRVLAADASSRQLAAGRIVSLLHETFVMPPSGEPACALVRCFQTSAYARLPLEYQHAANELLQHMPSQPNMRCLSLLSTRGVKKVWDDVATSARHQCIPLPSVEAVKRAPMIARLLHDFGVSVEELVGLESAAAGAVPAAPHPVEVPAARDSLDLFHVPEALGSPFVPAQAEFVEPYGVRSVLAMGGLLNEGDLFAVILFTRVPIEKDVAARFRPLADALQHALLPFASRDTFSGPQEESVT